MKAVILAAGRGSRMGALTKNTPKPLIKVLNKPLIEYVFEALPDDIDSCVVVVSYLSHQIKSQLGSFFKGKSVNYVNQVLPGTGGGLLSAKPFLQKKFLVVSADNIYNRSELKLLIGNNNTYGIICREKQDKNLETVCFDKNDILTGRRVASSLFETRWFGVGAYFLYDNIWLETFSRLPNGEYSIPHTLLNCSSPVYIKKFYTWISVNTPEDIANAEKKLVFGKNRF